MHRLALIGYGYWGPKLARVASSLPGAELAVICDRDAERRASAEKQHPGSEIVSEPEQVLERKDIDGVLVATPVSTHGPLVRAALLQGKHVLVEKPFVTESRQAEELLRLAEERRLTLMVGNTFLFSPPVQALRDVLARGGIGRLRYLHSQRLNLGLVRPDTNVIWDLAAHDIAILLYILPERPLAVQAQGSSYLQTGRAEIAFINLVFPSGIEARVDVSWLSPLKVRLFTAFGDRGMLVYDDTAPQPLRVLDRGIRCGAGKTIEYWDRGESAPVLEASEPLQVQCLEFLHRLAGREHAERPDFNLDVVRTLELSDWSLHMGGRWLRWTQSGATAIPKGRYA